MHRNCYPRSDKSGIVSADSLYLIDSSGAEDLSLPNVIAVDGPAGSGKSSVSFAVAQQIGYLFVDTGAFYRAVTLVALEQQVDVTNPDQITDLAQRTHLDMTPDLSNDGRQYT